MNIGVVTYCILTCIVVVKILHSDILPTVFVFVKNIYVILCVKSKTKKNKSIDTKSLCFLKLLLHQLAEQLERFYALQGHMEEELELF